jgi:hypothetical protein
MKLEKRHHVGHADALYRVSDDVVVDNSKSLIRARRVHVPRALRREAQPAVQRLASGDLRGPRGDFQHTHCHEHECRRSSLEITNARKVALQSRPWQIQLKI